MATIPQIAKVKPWLDKSGLKDTNFPLYQVILALIQGQLQTGQVIGASSSSSGNGITSLSGDVVATGPGAAVATIQPGVVTYAKIQDTVGSDILIGRSGTPGIVEEIDLGDNLIIENDQLKIETPDGDFGFAHPLLSRSHKDTIPFTPPESGDLIRAVETFIGTAAYINGFILAPTVEDFSGIYAGMVLGMPNGLIAPNGGAYSAQPFDYVTPTVEEYQIRLVPELIDAFILSLLVEDFVGIRQGYTALVPGGSEPGPGNYGAYSPPILNFIQPSTPIPEIEGRWERTAIGTEGQLLTVVNGIPEWASPFEFGTWTPVIGGSGGTTGQSYNTQIGYWWKFERFVWISGIATLSNKGTITGNVEIQGLPFAATNLANYRTSCAVNWALLVTAVNVVQGFMLPNTSVLGLFYSTGAGVVTVQQFVAADIANNTTFGFGFVYVTNP